jgi:plasmid stability protein
MELKKRKPTGREKDEASIKLLEKLREQLYSQHASNRRQAAFNLSWMQEDGLEILKAALLGDCNITSKNAAAYGLRKMRGRMKKMALEVLNQGKEHSNAETREVCRNALLRLEGRPQKKPVSKTGSRRSRYEIKDVRRTGKLQRRVGMMRNNRRGPISHKRPPRQ